MLFATVICENLQGPLRRCGSGNTEVSVIGIRLLPVGVVMCDWPGSHFWTSPLLYADEKG